MKISWFLGLIRLETLYLIFICLHMKNHLSDLQIHTIFWKTKINIANHVSLFQFWYFDNLLDKSKSEQNGTGRLERSHQLYSYHINSHQFFDWHAGEVETFVEHFVDHWTSTNIRLERVQLLVIELVHPIFGLVWTEIEHRTY